MRQFYLHYVAGHELVKTNALMKLSSAHNLYKSSGCHSLGWLPWGMLKRRLGISICGRFRQKLEFLVKHQTHQHQPGMLCVLVKR